MSLQKNGLRNSLKILFAILLSSLLSCAITPPDVPLCTEITPSRAYCINTISSREFEVSDTAKWNDKTWWEIRPYMIQMPSDSWVEIKSFIIKICKKYKCAGPKISSWQRTVKAIDKQVEAKK